MTTEAAAIKVENLVKTYKLYDSPVDRLKESLHPLRRKYHRDFNALNGITLDIAKGQTVGIIGQNGSGKSTFLKIVTGVLAPTSGTVTVDGKISALLELGTGFNPDLSGIENVYFSGTLLGYSREEMTAKLDGILAFADIGDFAHQPVKTYSTGMFVRLAFAVATIVDPDILIVDEALSVGDIRFQQKCYRKMGDFKDDGKTIIMVTHDLAAVKKFCDSVIWINEGGIRKAGDAEEVVKSYVSYMAYNAEASAARPEAAPSQALSSSPETGTQWDDVTGCSSFGEGGAEIKRVALYSADKSRKITTVEGREELLLMLDVQVKKDILAPIFGFILNDRYGNHIMGTNSYVLGSGVRPLNSGERIIVDLKFVLPALMNGEYIFAIAIAEGDQQNHIQHHWVHDACVLQVASTYEGAMINCFVVPEEAEVSIRE